MGMTRTEHGAEREDEKKETEDKRDEHKLCP